MGLYILSVVIVVLLIISYIVSAAETAFSSANELRMKTLAEENYRGARKAYWIMKNYDKTINTILFASSGCDIASTTLFAYVLGTLITNPTVANFINMVVMTIFIIIFCGIIPKTIAKINPDKYALKLAFFMFILIKAFTPIGWMLGGVQKLFSRKAKEKAGTSPTVTEEELETIIDKMEEEGVLDETAAELIQGAMELSAKTVYDVMTPRVEMMALSSDATKQEIKEFFLEEEFSRVPVYEEDKDNIIGIVYQKDYFKSIIKKDNKTLKDLLVPAMFVVENMRLKDLIKNMQFEKKHMAIVVDEHGGTSGIITLEDALESVVGEIYDEQDDETNEDTPMLVKLDDSTYELLADIEINELYEELELEYPPETEFTTVSSYLYELAEDMPDVNQTFDVITTDDTVNETGIVTSRTVKLTYKITEVEDRKIKKVKLTVKEIDKEE